MLSIISGPAWVKGLRLCALISCGVLGVAACEKLPLLAPQGSTITMSSTSSIVQANGTTQINATVLELGGTPVNNGTTVTFTTTVGSLSPTEARTLNGVASVQFLGNGQSGTAQVKAFSGGAASDALEISVGAAATGRVSVTANPTSVPATGGTTTISALVVDASGNPLNGVPVTFATTAGTFSAPVVNTDFSGIARTTLTTNREASVTATAGSTTSAAISITTSAGPTVSITTGAGTNTVEGGITTFSVTVNPGTNGGAIQNVTVNFDDGTTANLGAVSGTLTVQHVYDDDGSFTPTVTALDSNGASSTASLVIFVQPLIVSISTTKATTGNGATFVANTTAGVSIASYAWNFGDGTTQTTTTGTASHTYALPGSYTVRVTVRATTGPTATGTAAIVIP